MSALHESKQKGRSVCLRFFCIFEYKRKGHIGRPKVPDACPGFGNDED